ncbi:MAG: alanine--tRNA ligase, partial [Deltaproteobacteria bacterium]|nr:alanine--tRNA ligase [Deltaproteobacteria bacterium]
NSADPYHNPDQFLEIWNLVFIEFNRTSQGELKPLQIKCIDTGMGLERVLSIVQRVPSNFDTDLFRPIIKEIEKASGHDYKSTGFTSPKELRNLNEIEKRDLSLRVLSDHSRAITFLIAEGLLPGNEERQYVLRKLIRRACLFERNLGELNGKTLVAACDAVCDIFKDVYNEVDLYRCTIHQIVHSESDRFFSVLNDGLQYLKKQVKDGVISGKVAFTLHDTFGFPIELTRDIASDNQWELDEASFWTLMTRQKEQSKAAKTIFVGIRGSILRTEFTGYDSLSARAKVLQIQNIDNRIAMICDKTCFYAESGGQVADIGKVLFDGQSYQVVDVQKTAEGCFVHWLSVGEVNFGVDDFVLLEVDHQHRASVSRAHSATHLIHYALRKILGSETRQAGSRVTSDNLRFDFTYFGELPYSFVDDLEAIVNQLAFDSYSVEISYSTLEQALAKGALAFFGDKYDPSCVRLVKIGPSIELCGGTHVKYSCQILPVVINSVHSISSGVKRIEANVGLKAIQTSKRKMIEVQRALDLAKSKTNIVDTVQKLLTEVERGKQALSHLENKMSDIVFDSLSIHEFENCTLILLSSDLGFLAEKIFDRAMSRFRKVVVVAVPKSSATDLLVGSQIGFSADQTLKGLISRLGGKGGGNPRFARGFVSTKDEDRIKTALLEIFE